MNTIVTDAIGALVSAGVGSLAVYLTHKGMLLKFATWLKNHAGQIVQGAETVAGELLQTPAAKVAEAHIQHQFDNLQAQFQASEIGRLASNALHGLGVSALNLSDDQKKAIVLQISTMVPAEWNVTKEQIETAIDTAQKGAEAFVGTRLIQSANQFTQEQQVSTAPQQPA